MSKITWIIQASGRGLRMRHLTWNKPKALVSYAGQPLLFHYFVRFPEVNWIIVTMYKHRVMENYLSVWGDPRWKITQVVLHHSLDTSGGLDRALSLVPADHHVIISWCDLVIGDKFTKYFRRQILKTGKLRDHNYIGLSSHFPCGKVYLHSRSQPNVSGQRHKNGIAGFFTFKNKTVLKIIPSDVSFSDYAARTVKFTALDLQDTRDLGTYDSYSEESKKLPVCRPFNNITISARMVTKTPRDKQGRELIAKEINAYKSFHRYGLTFFPRIYSYHPLRMQRLSGDHPFNLDLSPDKKKQVIIRICDQLNCLHQKKSLPAVPTSLEEAYPLKTYARLEKVARLIPYMDKPELVINQVHCRNVFPDYPRYADLVRKTYTPEFNLIHGDPTFSNTLVDPQSLSIYFIDPRGYFGLTPMFGDPNYDWAKLLYSVIGNYDQFNRRNFRLRITGPRNISLRIASSGYENLAASVYDCATIIPDRLNLLHSLIWLSLTTWTWDDFDSICGAYYQGVLLANQYAFAFK